ncbi:hypothetical protein [Candidatus Methanoperedens nitratireducens]|uniref:hypothetical protein n=1 Tax=Candidatus Methanoperedens nitratireducens TaxID=1392998 RepID=UPI0011783643|nr:hypothetical protein [Candidatus Methanoperedens nitroreducens]
MRVLCSGDTLPLQSVPLMDIIAMNWQSFYVSSFKPPANRKPRRCAVRRVAFPCFGACRPRRDSALPNLRRRVWKWGRDYLGTDARRF